MIDATRSNVLVSCYDKEARLYQQPQVFANLPSARRAWMDHMNAKDVLSVMQKHPEDFALYVVGYWDAETGLIAPVQPVHEIDLTKLMVAARPTENSLDLN